MGLFSTCCKAVIMSLILFNFKVESTKHASGAPVVHACTGLFYSCCKAVFMSPILFTFNFKIQTHASGAPVQAPEG